MPTPRHRTKPPGSDEIRARIDALRPWLVGGCEAFQDFASELTRIAGSDVTVLLQGENGSGKGQAARALHGLGPRAARPFVEVGLAALAPTLIEAELFGHEEGAFTGAGRARAGRFRRAEGGTLVLDGIESLPDELQVKLLRVLQERRVSPLGSMEELPIDVRIVATSAKDLLFEVEAGRFRQDLYYRIAVVTLAVPPLRTRLADLPLLVEHVTRRRHETLGVPVRALTPEALERLARHAWPGNVRELENALERVLILAPGAEVPADGSPPPVGAAEFEFLDEAVRGSAERIATEALANGLTAAELDRALLELALREQRGNVSAAARRLGLTRRTFEYRLSRLHGADGGTDPDLDPEPARGRPAPDKEDAS